MGEAAVVLVRSVVTFLSLLIFCRILGKTQISQMSFFEYVSGITLGSIAAELSVNLAIRPWPIYVALAAWTVLTLATQYVALKSRWMAKMLDGEPVVVIRKGQILERNLRMLRFRESELTALLRAQGIFDYNTVEYAILEPRGDLSVLKRSENRPVTPADLGLPVKHQGLGIELVVDGEIMEQNLRRLRLDRTWLLGRLREHGASSPSEVFLAVINADGKLYIDRYTDRTSQVEDLSDYPGPN